MIAGATRGAGGPALGTHLASAAGNEQVMTLEGRGLTTEGIREQVAELTRMVSHARTRTPLYHVHADPPADRPWTAEERAEYWHRFEQEFGLEGRPFAAVAHSKDGRDHEHRVYVRVRADGTAIRLDHDHARREKVNRTFEYDRGEPLTKGAHNRAIIAALGGERPDVAAAMLAAGSHEGQRPRAALTPGERAQQERTKVSKADVARATAAAWKHSDNGPAFAAALAERGLRLAQGDTAPVVVDATGNSHAVGRMLDMAAKAEGTDAPKSQVIRDRLDGLDLPNVDEAKAARQAAGAVPAAPAMAEAARGPLAADLAPAAPDRGQPIPAPTEQASTPAPGQPAPAAAEQAAAPATAAASRDARPAVSGGGNGGSAPASSDGGGGGMSMEITDGPGEPPGPGASIQEVQRYRERLFAYEERRGQAYARQQAGITAENDRNSKKGGIAHAHVQAPAHAGTSSAPSALAIFAAGRQAWPEARPRAAPAQSGHVAYGQPVAGRDTRDQGQGAGGGEPVGRPDGTAPGRGPEPDNGNPGGPRGRAGIAAPDGTAAGGARAHARQAIQARAAQARLAAGVAAQPDALAALRRARAELDPAWRERRDAWQRIRADRAGIAAILATPPHPNPTDRDPVARATAYAGQVSDGYRERKEAAEKAQAEALAALAGRGIGIRLLAAIGISTPEQRHALAAVALALKLTDEAERQQPTPADYREARAAGTTDAYAAQARTRAWEAVPDVAAALEQARLNKAVDAAAESSDPEIVRTLKLGDPEAARAIIREREENSGGGGGLERRQGVQRGTVPTEPGPGGPPGPSELR